MVNEGILSRIGERLTKAGGGVAASDLVKGMWSGMSNQMGYGNQMTPTPPYQRHFSPLWLYELRRNSALINNACEEKIKQTFKDGFTEWTKTYDAKCPACETEFQGFDPFRKQLGEAGEELDDDDIDLDSERPCPDCGEQVEMITPDPSDREEAQSFFQQVNENFGEDDIHLEPDRQNSTGQKMLEVLEEIAWDIQSHDDGWLVFERSYAIDDDGVIYGYDLETINRAPPELMRYSIDPETGKAGGEFWVCIHCRTHATDYYPENEDRTCSDCGRETYEAYAYQMHSPGGDPERFFIRGEFVHDSEYERKKWYGFSPILSLWEEARTLEQMDKWYNDAYEERRAPRGALSLNVNRDEQLRNYNRQQMENLRSDPNYIPLFMNGNEGEDNPPIEFISLLEDPASMQHMEMREWFKDRISAKYGVTSILMSGSPENSGLSQSMEVEVSQKSAESLRKRFNETYLPAILGQLGIEGWDVEIAPALEEDEAEQAQLVGQHLNNAQKAVQLGAEVVWTEDDCADIKQGELEAPEDEMGGMGAGGPMGGMGGGGGMDMMGMDGGIDDSRGPSEGSLPEGEHANQQDGVEEGDRVDPNDPDRPAATPLKALPAEVADTLEKAEGETSFGQSRAQQVAEEVFA